MTESDTSCQAPAAALATLLVPVHSRGPCATCALLTAGCRCCSGSPLSQKVTLRALRAARGQRLGAVLQMDFRIVVRMVAGPSDFQEGVRVTLIDRSGQPCWSPATLEEVRPLQYRDSAHAPQHPSHADPRCCCSKIHLIPPVCCWWPYSKVLWRCCLRQRFPSRCAQVTDEMVDRFFAPLPPGEELQLAADEGCAKL